MKFQLRDLLIVVVLTALLFAPLAKPSRFWLMLLPTFAAVFVTAAIAKASKNSDSAFWKAMPSGAFAYLFMVQFIGYPQRRKQ